MIPGMLWGSLTVCWFNHRARYLLPGTIRKAVVQSSVGLNFVQVTEPAWIPPEPGTRLRLPGADSFRNPRGDYWVDSVGSLSTINSAGLSEVTLQAGRNTR